MISTFGQTNTQKVLANTILCSSELSSQRLEISTFSIPPVKPFESIEFNVSQSILHHDVFCNANVSFNGSGESWLEQSEYGNTRSKSYERSKTSKNFMADRAISSFSKKKVESVREIKLLCEIESIRKIQ